MTGRISIVCVAGSSPASSVMVVEVGGVDEVEAAEVLGGLGVRPVGHHPAPVAGPQRARFRRVGQRLARHHRRPGRARPGRSRCVPHDGLPLLGGGVLPDGGVVGRGGRRTSLVPAAAQALAQLEAGLGVGKDAHAGKQVVEVGALDQVEAGELLDRLGVRALGDLRRRRRRS